MPNENKKRGRREDKKRKLEASDELQNRKRRKSEGETGAPPAQDQEQAEFRQYEDEHPHEQVFFGMLEEQEQEYFKRADEMLELNQFADDEERALFLANLYRESDGKELKIACSQSCSRLMERLILLSSSAQLKILFRKFNGHFLHLFQHRFASHCCEALFIQAASIVTQEILHPYNPKNADINEEVYVSMENMFLFTLNDLEGSFGYLMTDSHASHPLRLLLVILSGRPLIQSSRTSLLRSKRKEKIRVAVVSDQSTTEKLEHRQVPESFGFAIGKIVQETVATLDTTSLHSLATHPIGNPFLQLLLTIELAPSTASKARADHPLLDKLLSIETVPEAREPVDDVEESTKSAFLTGMLYDPIGSRLVETIVTHAPGKIFKGLYRGFFKEKIRQHARNETASYVVMRLLERLSKEDLQQAVEAILPEIPSLVERSRTAIIKTMVERCAVRKAPTEALAEAIESAYSEDGSFQLRRLLRFEQSEDHLVKGYNDETSKQDMSQLHGSLLAQALLAVPGRPSELIYNSLLELSVAMLVSMAERPTASHVLQASLKLPTSSVAFRRKLISRLFGRIALLAVNTSGSHVIDALWTATHGLIHCRERIAQELLTHEAEIRGSFVGKAVWRNWMMDLYSRRRTDWIVKAKAGEPGAPDPKTEHSLVVKRDQADVKPGLNASGTKSGIELAREKFAASRARAGAGRRGGGSSALSRGTGANMVSRVSGVDSTR